MSPDFADVGSERALDIGQQSVGTSQVNYLEDDNGVVLTQ
jgi:hypothetical protein